MSTAIRGSPGALGWAPTWAPTRRRSRIDGGRRHSSGRGLERGAELGHDAARGADGEPRAGVVVLLGEHAGALVDRVHQAVLGPQHVELGVLELAGELLDQPVVEPGDVGAIL